MPTKAQAFVVHPAQGGWDTITAPTLLAPDWLQLAENIEYYKPGNRAKRKGTTLHAAMGSSIEVQAMVDFWWRDGTTDVQYLVAIAQDGIYLNDTPSSGGSFVLATGGSGFSGIGAEANFVIAQGQVIASHSLGTQKPRRAGSSTAGFVEVSTCVPKFTGAVYHLSRLWAFGEPATPSTVYFSAASDITDWIGEDASSLILDENDMDRVVGISKPFRGGIYAFKGPHVGSIHAISGRTIRQFARDRIMDAAPCVGHKTIITTPNDIYWLSIYGAHSLNATQKYGNTEEAYLSHKIRNVWDELQTDAMQNATGFYHPTRNLIGWFVPEAGSTRNTICLVYNYALGLWAKWFYPFDVCSCMIALDPTPGVAAKGRQRLYLGGYDGRIWKADQANLVDGDGSGIPARIRFPNLIRLGDVMTEMTEKQFHTVTTFFTPNSTDSDTQVNVTIDGRLTTTTMNLQSTGGQWGSGLWGTAVWGGSNSVMTRAVSVDGIGRAIQVEYVNTAPYQDLSILGYAIRAVPAEAMAVEAET